MSAADRLLASAVVAAIAVAAPPAWADARRMLYAVNQATASRGTISVYDIDAGHRLLKTIATVPDVRDVRGAAASAATGRLYVAYDDRAGVGRIFCLNLGDDSIVWNSAIADGVDRLAISPDGRRLFVPTGEERTADHINVIDAATGDVVRRVVFSMRSHDAQFPPSGPLFQETKATDGSGNYLYRVNPVSFAVARVGPYAGVLGPYAVNGTSTVAVGDVTHLWGMQVADLRTGRIITAELRSHPSGDPGLMHGIGWTPDQSEVWQSSRWNDPHVYVWDMRDPLHPVPKDTLALRSGHGSHWLTFSIAGDYAYVAPNKNSDDGTEIFDPRTHAALGTIASSEDMLEVDFAGGKVVRVGDQFGIGRQTP